MKILMMRMSANFFGLPNWRSFANGKVVNVSKAIIKALYVINSVCASSFNQWANDECDNKSIPVKIMVLMKMEMEEVL